MIDQGRTKARRDPLTAGIIGAAIEVHRQLGPGLLESLYEECLAWELASAGMTVARKILLPVAYKGVRVEAGYRLDMLVDGRVVVELKAVARLLPVHDAQLLTYMRLTHTHVGLLLNFNTAVLRDGIRRLVL